MRQVLISMLGCLLLLSVSAGAAPVDGGASMADAGPPPSWNDTARYLAGLSVEPTSPLAALESKRWKVHSSALDAGWAKLEAGRLTKMDAWAKKEVAPNINSELPVLYFFGGPDAITVDVIYPDAPRYLLFGLEKPGAVPPLTSLPTPELEQGLKNFMTTLKTTISMSYFVTETMGGDLRRTRLTGVLPLLLVFLARHQDTVTDVDHVYIDAKGALMVADPAQMPADGVPGVRVKFLRHGAGVEREVLYFSTDLINDALPKRPGLFTFLDTQGDMNSFFKAASFILHDKNFSLTRDYVLAHSASILQDDSGVPWRFLSPKNPKFTFTFFGEYTPNAKVFETHFQEDMKAAWDKAKVRPLPFRTGYPHEHGSDLVLAVRKPADADAGR